MSKKEIKNNVPFHPTEAGAALETFVALGGLEKGIGKVVRESTSVLRLEKGAGDTEEEEGLKTLALKLARALNESAKTIEDVWEELETGDGRDE